MSTVADVIAHIVCVPRAFLECGLRGVAIATPLVGPTHRVDFYLHTYIHVFDSFSRGDDSQIKLQRRAL